MQLLPRHIHTPSKLQRQITAPGRNARTLSMASNGLTGMVLLTPLAAFWAMPYPPTHTNSLCSSHTHLLPVPWIYNVTSHIITSPCNSLFSTPRFALLTPTDLSDLKSLPSLTSHLPMFSQGTKHFSSWVHPVMAGLSAWLFESCLSLPLNGRLREDYDSLTHQKKYSIGFKIEEISQNLVTENDKRPVFLIVYFQCFPTFLLYKYVQIFLKP